MALTADDLKALARPFRFDDHEFTRGYVYIREDSIAARIEEVDPSWAWNDLHIERGPEQVTVSGSLTIKGVTRVGVGMQSIEHTIKDSKLTKEKMLAEIGEPEKGAATDALKRAARLFGVGRYLLSAPKEGPTFKRWLADQQREAGMLPSVPQPPADPLREVGKELGGVETPKVVGWKSKAEAQTFVREMEKAHGLTDTQVFTALGVDRLGAWTQGIEAARQRVEKWHSANVNAEADKQSA